VLGEFVTQIVASTENHALSYMVFSEAVDTLNVRALCSKSLEIVKICVWACSFF